MIERTHKHSLDTIISLWEYQNGENGNYFKSEVRIPLIENLCALMKTDNYGYEDVSALKSRVIDFLVHDKGQKESNKKVSPYYGWLPNAQKDFDRTLSGFFIDEEALKDNYFGDQYLSSKSDIEKWVKETFDTQDEGLIKEAHRFFGHLMIKWAQEGLMK